MRKAGVAELKARLSAFLLEVREGREVLVTDRGRPVAKLVPASAARRGSRRERLAREGLLRIGRGRVRPALRSAPSGKQDGTGVLDALLAERDEAR